MKRHLFKGMLAAAIALPALSAATWAQDNDRQGGAPACSLATLKGQYPFAGSGTLFPPAFGVTAQSAAASAGYHIFNGDGTGTDYVTFTVNGVNQNVPSPVAITYTLHPDCTGTYSVQNGPSFAIFVAVDGSALSVIDTNPGVSFSAGPNPRVGFGQ